MLLIAIGWLYVAGMVAIVQALGRNGTLLGALFTFVGCGLLPVALLGYLMLSPARRRGRRVAEADPARSAPLDPDQRSVAPADAVTPVREEP